MSLAAQMEAASGPVLMPPGFPTDVVFDGVARDQLVWLPELGMGRLKVVDAPYDAEYFEKYERYAATEMGRAITRARVGLVDAYTRGTVVDIGIGCGSFIEGRGRLNTWGFDINPEGVRWLKDSACYLDPYAEDVQSVSLWDTLEHIPDPGALLRRVREFVFVSLPIVPGDGPPPLDWKHLRRDEHCWYWTRAGFRRWMDAHGFTEIECSPMEQALGRSDILTFVFRRRR